MLDDKRILLIISGGIAAYKSLELIRRVREHGGKVRCVLTSAAANFITPMSVATLSEDRVYGELFSLTAESEIGHIKLSRDADLVVVAPATANILAKMAHGIADDLATTLLLATDKDVLVAPAMNVRMWQHAATQENVATLKTRNIIFSGPAEGKMACGEYGLGKMIEPQQIYQEISHYFSMPGPLAGRRAIVTSGPTYEAIDPVRYIGNRSSGKQGHAIAAALSGMGADTVLITGPTNQIDPYGVETVRIESALELHAAVLSYLPADIAVCAAAVADWRIANATDRKIKKTSHSKPPQLKLIENPDVLHELSAVGEKRPKLIVGFAAETEQIVKNAKKKRENKGCDWIIANNVSPSSGTFGGDSNVIHLLTETGTEDWPEMDKTEIANRLAKRIADHFRNISQAME
ncbi:MAG: bifunctional phosphopantothenoylcysteine decarboxylase/phosphopantothenate--cysteine ligase CoaBC [Pseudomonadota bacterium]|nr:bifunctional phosphopantothenoylcysteine decarboxylase/phosphopantothenate--cysteine ligase CoaBC [Pseudomonadota bacterium]